MWDLAEAYARESSAPELGGADVQIKRYTHIESVGGGQGFLLTAGGRVRGFLFVLIYPVPHHAHPIATVESIFALRGGHMLIAAAKDYARRRGAKALHITAPAGGRLARRMVKDRAARKSSEVFVWAL